MITGLLILILLLGAACALVYRYVPIPNGFKVAFAVVCFIVIVFRTLQVFGIALP